MKPASLPLAAALCVLSGSVQAAVTATVEDELLAPPALTASTDPFFANGASANYQGVIQDSRFRVVGNSWFQPVGYGAGLTLSSGPRVDRDFGSHSYTNPNNPPVFEGVRLVESWTHGYSDYIDTNGRHWGYATYILENGDKLFARNDGSSQTVANADGKKSTATGVTTLSGGTGKVRGIQGTLRYVVIFDPKAGLNEGQVEGTYWIEK